MPASIKLKQQFGDDLTVIFVESQGTPPADTEAFIYRMKWGASEAWWTHERPCEAKGSGLPTQTLLGNDGRVLLEGHLAFSAIEEAIEQEIRAARSAPKGTPRALSKAYQDFAKSAWADAIQVADRLAATPPEKDKDGVAEAARAAAAEWRRRASARIERLKYLIDNALFAKAQAEVRSLQAAVKGVPELEQKLSDHAATLTSEETKAAREAAQALDKALEKVNAKGIDEKTSAELKKLADKYSGTKPGERAAHLSALLVKK